MYMASEIPSARTQVRIRRKWNGVDLEYDMLSIRDLMTLGSQHRHVRTYNLPLPALMQMPLLSAQEAWTLFIQMTENEQNNHFCLSD